MNSTKSNFSKRFPLQILIIITCINLFVISCDDSDTVQETESTDNGIAFVNVNVIPMDHEGVLEGYTVLVRDDRITEVGPYEEVSVPSGAEIIEGDGRYLMPGLAEMHGHIPGPDNPEYAEGVLFLYVSNGVTLVRNMAGHPYHLELIEQVENGEITGPTIFAASPWMSPQQAATPEEVDQLVREHHEAGFDLMKMGSISLEVYEQMAETAHEVGIPFAGHIPEEVGLIRALEARQASIDHYDRYVEFLVPEDADWGDRSAGFFGSGVVDLADTDRIPLAVERTIEAGTWNVPTLSLVEHLADPTPGEEMIQWPEMQYMPRNVLDGWVESKQNFQARDDFQPDAAQRLVEIRQMLTRELIDQGAPVALGSDAPQFFNVPGFSIHHEMRMMVDAGLTPYEVLVTGTRNPAIYFETPDEFGTVETNRRADLILLEANPLEDIGNVQQRVGVMVRGEWMPEEEIQQRLQQIAEAVGSAD
jgi:cytosine/adenosine deaminase-related metal-dependent hydrolase